MLLREFQQLKAAGKRWAICGGEEGIFWSFGVCLSDLSIDFLGLFAEKGVLVSFVVPKKAPGFCRLSNLMHAY